MANKIMQTSNDRGRLRQRGRPYDSDLLNDGKLSNNMVYQKQLDKDVMNTKNFSELFDIRETEFLTNKEAYIRYETENNGCKRGFVIREDAFRKLTKTEVGKLFGELRV